MMEDINISLYVEEGQMWKALFCVLFFCFIIFRSNLQTSFQKSKQNNTPRTGGDQLTQF